MAGEIGGGWGCFAIVAGEIGVEVGFRHCDWRNRGARCYCKIGPTSLSQRKMMEGGGWFSEAV